jgi:hypothetical protein
MDEVLAYDPNNPTYQYRVDPEERYGHTPLEPDDEIVYNDGSLSSHASSVGDTEVRLCFDKYNSSANLSLGVCVYL